jgi:hypothetical protein
MASTSTRSIATALAMSFIVSMVELRASSSQAAIVGMDAPVDGSALEVKVDPEMFQGEAHRGWVQARGQEVLERRPVALEPGDRIVVELGGTSRDYRVTVRVLLGGEAIAEQPAPFQCKGSSDELLKLMETAVDDAVDRLIAERNTRAQAERDGLAREQAERDRIAKEQAAEDARKASLAAKPYRPARLGVAGAVATALGGALVVSGAVVTSRGEVASDNDLLGTTDFRPPGYVLLGVGSAVLVAGIGMLVVDVVRCKKDRVVCGERTPVLRRAAWQVGPRGLALRW